MVLLFATNVVMAQNQTIHNSLFALFADSLGASPSEIGMMVFLSGVVATSLMIPSGTLAERYGKKRVILFSIILQAVALFLYTVAQDWRQLIPLNMLFAASFALFISARAFHVSKTQVGIFYSLGFGLATLLFQVPTGYLADKKGYKRKILIFCSVTIPAPYLLCTLAGNYLTLMVIYLFVNALWSMTWPTSMAILLDAVPASAKQLAISVRQTSIRLGSTIGPLLGGFSWQLGGGIGLFFIAALFVAASIPAVILQKSSDQNSLQVGSS